MGSRTAPARATGRLVLAYVVLAGLFVMHGVLAGQGCPGGGAAAGSRMAVHGSATGHEAAAMAQMAQMAMYLPATGQALPALPALSAVSAVSQTPAVVRGDGRGHGTLCVSSPPRPGLAWLLALLLGVVAWAWPVRLWNAGADRAGHRCRAPPPAGSCLLVRLCVSRT
ncbi:MULTISPECIES: hypothetical protein [unclassified Frankia]|uniref:hypothetical protein n=1 Tax=unclassified Frankia TaxID=2632575 RepID=UPI002AD54E2A|nr:MULTISPECIES: hypothetical protein [unclassified Frankia]